MDLPYFTKKVLIQIILKHCHSYLFAEPQLPSQQGAEPQLPSQQIVAPQDHQQGTPQQQQQQHRRKRDEARIAVSPADICPLPCAPVKTFYRKRSGATAILTSTSYKNKLEEASQSKKRVVNKASLNKKAMNRSETLSKKADCINSSC